MTPNRIAELEKIGFNWEIRHVETKKSATGADKFEKPLKASHATVTLRKVVQRQVRVVPHAA